MKLIILSSNLFVLTFLFVSGFSLYGQQDPLEAEDAEAQKRWVDSVYHSLSLKEKVGQLFVVDVFSNGSGAEIDKVKKLIDKQSIGGVIFSKGGPQRQAKLTNEFQELSKTPLLIGMDAEWGLAMRLDSTFALPWNMTLGAIKDNKLIEQAGAAISKHTKRLGVHINFAPVVDINTNPFNPIIGTRSFGENKENVTEKALAFMKGMHREGMLSSAKHFPGHGDTSSDSHKTLPTIGFSRERIEEVELMPYRHLISQGLSSVMIAHLNVPALEDHPNLPSSLSKSIVNDLLKEELAFKGLVFTDALNMKGVSNHKSGGGIDLAAFMAGNDILLISEDVPKASEKIIEAFEDKTISAARLAHSVKKILSAKYKVGLNNYKPVDTVYLHEELNSVRDHALYENLMENAITLIKNNKGVVPIKELKNKKIAYINFGDDDGSPFLKQMRKYGQIDWVRDNSLNGLLDKLEDYDYVIAGFHKSNSSPWASYKFSSRELQWIYEIAKKNKIVLSVFANPYSLMGLKTHSNIEGIIVGYQNSNVAQEKVAQALFGAFEITGRLPVSIGNDFPEGTGYTTKSLGRLAYGLPETVGMNSSKLSGIDKLVNQAIDEKMTPGVQIVVARKGKVIYQKNKGFHTYEENIPVTDTSVYDLASLTKILATLPLLMEQEENGIINFNTTLGEMLPSFVGSNKEHLQVQNLLMHFARLKAWIPFYVPTIDKLTKKPSDIYYSAIASDKFNTQIAEDMFIRNDMQDTIVEIIKESDLVKQQKYVYSDLPYYLFKHYLENYNNTTLHNLTQDRLYKSLGANYTGFLPKTRFSLDQIAPTEEDKLWRNQRVHGYVHDQGAAMQGGIGGHAGLFSTANDVAKIMQMFLNGGTYGGTRFFKEETVEKFNTCYYCDENIRRGVGFDKPQLRISGPTCNCVSMSSFGHSGFTGTFAWADPEEEIVYIFLSNRTFPNPNNRKLISENIRSKIQEVIYESIDF